VLVYLCLISKHANNWFSIKVGEEKMGKGKVVGGIIALIVIAVAVVFALEYFQVYSVPVLGPALGNLLP
jgi:Ca2+/Na+ antiporter